MEKSIVLSQEGDIEGMIYPPSHTLLPLLPRTTIDQWGLYIPQQFHLIQTSKIDSNNRYIPTHWELLNPHPYQIEPNSSIVESLHTNKRMIYQDKLQPCDNFTQIMKLFKTSVPVSTSRGEDYVPFFQDVSKEISKRLWLPIETDCVDLALNSSNTSSSYVVPNSSLWKVQQQQLILNPQNNLLKTLWPSYKSIAAGNKEKEDTSKSNKKKKTNQRAQMRIKQQKTKGDEKQVKIKPTTFQVHKIRLFPTNEQQKLLATRFDVKVKLYNLVLRELTSRVNQLLRCCFQVIKDNPSGIDDVQPLVRLVSRYLLRAQNNHKELKPVVDKKKIKKELESRNEHARSLVNRIIEYYQQPKSTRQRKLVRYHLLKPWMKEQQLRNEFVTNRTIEARKCTSNRHYNRITKQLVQLSKRAPVRIRYFTVDSLVKAFEANESKLKNEDCAKPFSMGYKTYGQADSITMESPSVKLNLVRDEDQKVTGSTVTIFEHRSGTNWQIGPIKMQEVPFVRKQVEHNVSISRDEQGKFYLLLTFNKDEVQLKSLTPAPTPKGNKRKRTIEMIEPHPLSLEQYDCINQFRFVNKMNKRSQQIAQEAYVAIDPGIRKALTYYSPSGSSGYIGVHVNSLPKIKKQNQMIVKVDSLLADSSFNSSISSKKRKRLRRKRRKCFASIRNCTKDAHYKTVHWLLSRYETILIPKLQVSEMVQRETPNSSTSSLSKSKKRKISKSKKRKISKQTTKNLLALSHATFWTRLEQKASEYPNRNVLFVSEGYTTKTCGSCGTIHDVGSSEVFRCPSFLCKLFTQTVDRDLHAARNIFLRWCTKIVSSS